MSHFVNLFSNYYEVKQGHVSMENDKKCPITGVGDIHLRFKSSSTYMLKDVRYVLGKQHKSSIPCFHIPQYV